jgi:LuxR family transcriptional regulator, regulator of acetate metabolism
MTPVPRPDRIECPARKPAGSADQRGSFVDEGGAAAHTAIEKLLPERLLRLQRLTGLPVVFGGSTRPAAGGRQLVLSRVLGTFGSSLLGLVVPSGRGLGGTVLRSGTSYRIDDYRTTTKITHDYDRIVVGEERIVGIFAVPVLVRGAIHGVLYGAARDEQPIGDRTLREASLIASLLEQDVEAQLHTEPKRSTGSARTPIEELAEIIRETPDLVLRTRLLRIHRALGGGPIGPTVGSPLAPRELDALRLVAVGASNMEIAARLGLSPETVKAYLRSAMRKLDVRNRTAAVHAARLAGVL